MSTVRHITRRAGGEKERERHVLSPAPTLRCQPVGRVTGREESELHDRMPVILAEIDWPKWLGEEPASEQELLALLKPCRDEALKILARR
jgi:putative SOS response-associated peptidase YedK